MPAKTTTAPDLRVAAAVRHNRAIGGSAWITYDGIEIMVPLRDVMEAREALLNGRRTRIMASVNTSLKRFFPLVKAEKAPQRLAMKIAQDVAIWFANELIEGRAKLESH